MKFHTRYFRGLFIAILLLPFSYSYAQSPQSLENAISHLQSEWARIKYQLADKEQQIKEIHALGDEAAILTATYPQRAEAKIWQGIILSTDAGIERGFSALGKLKQARDLFLASIENDPAALQGSAYTSLASLYYQVPGWPVSFGSNKKAREYFEQALAINPNGIDSNFFYGDFLVQQKKYDEAKKHLTAALNAPARSGRKLADESRKQEVRAALANLDDNKYKD